MLRMSRETFKITSRIGYHCLEKVKCFPRPRKSVEKKSAYLSQILFQLFNYKILQLVSFFWSLKGEWIAKFVLWGIYIVGNYWHSHHYIQIWVLLCAKKQFRGSVHRIVSVPKSSLELPAPCFNSLPTLCVNLYCNPRNFWWGICYVRAM